jgi:hypothetical protein
MLLVLLMGVGLSGCDLNLLEVELPGETEASSLDDPVFAPLLVTSAEGDFECAFSNYTLLSGILAGTFMDAQNVVSLFPYGMHNVRPSDGSFGTGSCAGGTGVYTPLSTARWSADNALTKIAEFTDAEVPDKTSLQAKAATYAGYSYTLFGESFCEAAFDLSPSMSPAEIFERADDRFTSAIDFASAAGDTEILNMARVGRARVLLNLGRASDAAADARLVPAGFVKEVTHSSAATRRENKVYTFNVRAGRVSVETAFRDLEYGGVPDPRVSVEDTGNLGQDLITPLWIQHKHTSESDPIVLASYDEAQLIIAEADGGQTAVDIINDFHTAAGLPAFASSDPAEIMGHIIEERRRELFLESHYMGDLRRYNLPFPTGNHPFKGWEYGTTTCFPLPDVERDNNPNIP